jgi:hypothetical protein
MKSIITIVCDLDRGGTQRAAINFAKQYLKDGFDSYVSVCRDSKNIPLEHEGIKIINFSDILKIDHDNVDVIHIHNHAIEPKKIIDYFNLIRSRYGKKIKIIETNVFSKVSPWESYLDYSYQLSSWAKKIYLERGGNPAKSKVCPNPLENNFSEKSKDIAKRLVIGRIGQNNMGNWSYHYADITSYLLKHINCEFIYVGMPNEIKKQLPKSKNIFHLDTVNNDEDLAQLYKKIDMFVHIAQVGESFGYVNFEAISNGCNVLTLQTPWSHNSQSEYMFKFTNGHVFHSIKNIRSFIIKHKGYRNNGLPTDEDKKLLESFDSKFLKDIILNNQEFAMSNHKPEEILSFSNDNAPLIAKMMFHVSLRKLIQFTSGFKGLGDLIKTIKSKIK